MTPRKLSRPKKDVLSSACFYAATSAAETVLIALFLADSDGAPPFTPAYYRERASGAAQEARDYLIAGGSVYTAENIIEAATRNEPDYAAHRDAALDLIRGPGASATSSAAKKAVFPVSVVAQAAAERHESRERRISASLEETRKQPHCEDWLSHLRNPRNQNPPAHE